MSHSHCEDESHGHSHSPPPESIPGDSLYSKIYLDRVRCLNEHVEGMARSIIKPWDLRLDTDKVLESDADEQLIISVPFTGQVKLKSILLRAPYDTTAPKTIKVFHNREDIDFSTAAELPATEVITTIPPTDSTHHGEITEYPVKRVNFNNVRNITLYIEDNWSDGEEETSTLWYIGFKGEWTELKDAPLITVYEAHPNPADHKKIASMRGLRHGLGH